MVSKGLRTGFGPGRIIRGWTLGNDLVHQAESLGFFWGHEPVALHGIFDGLQVLASVPDVDLVEAIPRFQDLFGMDLDVRGLALEAARRLMDHDVRMRQAEAFALRSGCQQ